MKERPGRVRISWIGDTAISKGLRTNEQIRISPILLIDESDDKIGTLDTAEAIRRARDAGMDLVEVSPNSRPPVCRIMDYGKWKYRQNKKEQKSHRHHVQQLKEVRLRPKTDVHDRDYKIKHAREFLLEGDRVQFTILFRGREMAHQDLAYRRMGEIAEGLVELAKVETPPKMAGKRMTMVLAPLKKGGPKEPSQNPATPREPATSPASAGGQSPGPSSPMQAAPPPAASPGPAPMA